MLGIRFARHVDVATDPLDPFAEISNITTGENFGGQIFVVDCIDMLMVHVGFLVGCVTRLAHSHPWHGCPYIHDCETAGMHQT